MSEKKRLDVLLTERGLQESRQRAQAVIMSGEVFVNGQRVDKPGTAVAEDAQIEVRGGTLAYVSRGGLKLEKAMAAFPIDLNGAVCADIGASTGGFTDCMLQNGAVRVYAVDVGHGQLHASLREDPRVICLEGTDARSRELAAAVPAGTVQLVTADVSFISEKAVLPAVLPYLAPSARLVVLIKPQFEAGRQAVGKNGVVKDPRIHRRVLDDMLAFFAGEGLRLDWLSFSPVTGGEGNIEYLAVLTAPPCDGPPLCPDTQGLVKDAFAAFSPR